MHVAAGNIMVYVNDSVLCHVYVEEFHSHSARFPLNSALAVRAPFLTTTSCKSFVLVHLFHSYGMY